MFIGRARGYYWETGVLHRKGAGQFRGLRFVGLWEVEGRRDSRACRFRVFRGLRFTAFRE